MLTKDFRSREGVVFCKLRLWDRGTIFLRGQIITHLPLVSFTSSCEREAGHCQSQVWDQRAGLSRLELPMVLLCFENRDRETYSSVIGYSQDSRDSTGASEGRSPDMPIPRTLAGHVWREIGLWSNCCTNGGNHVERCAPGKYTCSHPWHDRVKDDCLLSCL